MVTHFNHRPSESLVTSISTTFSTRSYPESGTYGARHMVTHFNHRLGESLVTLVMEGLKVLSNTSLNMNYHLRYFYALFMMDLSLKVDVN
jgi:hypothetical protein